MKASDFVDGGPKVKFTAGENGIDMYLLGRTVKSLSVESGRPITADARGNPIFDGELYCCSSKGIWLVE
jgi:hypothetical protein